MVALSAILVPAALTLMIGTRGKMKTSALLRDAVQRYDQDPKLTSSSAYGPKTGIDVDAHTSQAILRLQLVEKLRPGKGTTGFLEVDVAVGKWSHAYNVVGGNEPKLEESTLGSSNKGRNPGRTTTLDSYSTRMGTLALKVDGLCHGDTPYEVETLTLTWVTPPRAYSNPAKAAAAKAKRTNLLTLQLRCVLSAKSAMDQHDSWCFVPDASGQMVNACVDDMEEEEVKGLPAVKDAAGNQITAAVPALKGPIPFFWAVADEDAKRLNFCASGRPDPNARAYLPLHEVMDSLYSGHNGGFGKLMATDTAFGREMASLGRPLVEGLDYFDACLVPRLNTRGGKYTFHKIRFVSASVLKAFFGRRRGEKLHGYDLGLPTPYRAAARALDAECVCENHAHALRVSESTGKHNSKHAAMLASTIAGCMAQDIYAKELGTATGWKRGNDWLRKGHGGCGKLPGTGEEEEEEVARRKRTCADRVTPLYGPDGAYEHLRAGWFDKFSKECPWEGTTSDGRILSLRVWTQDYVRAPQIEMLIVLRLRDSWPAR